MSYRIIGGQNHGAQLDHRGMEAPRRNKLGSGISAMILSYHDSVPPTFADKQVNAQGAPGLQRWQFPLFPVGRVPSRGWTREFSNRLLNKFLCQSARRASF